MHDRLQMRLREIHAPADVCAMAADLAEQAVRDPLTGLYNRRFYDAALAQNCAAAGRYGRELSLVLLDLDGLKALNDAGGHAAGDAILRRFAQLLQTAVRSSDIACRIGGDEFAVILPETPAGGAGVFLDRLFVLLTAEGIRASAGVAALPQSDLFAAADAALYEAKRRKSGR